MQESERDKKRGGFGVGCLVTGVVLLTVGAVGAFHFTKWGLGVVRDSVKKELAENPVILERIGTIETMEFDLEATRDQKEADLLVFDVIGTQGKGVLEIDRDATGDGPDHVRGGRLVLPDGTIHDLFPEGPPR